MSFVTVDAEREVFHLKIGCAVVVGSCPRLAAELDTKVASCSCHMVLTFFTLGHLKSILDFMAAPERR